MNILLEGLLFSVVSFAIAMFFFRLYMNKEIPEVVRFFLIGALMTLGMLIAFLAWGSTLDMWISFCKAHNLEFAVSFIGVMLTFLIPGVLGTIIGMLPFEIMNNLRFRIRHLKNQKHHIKI